MKYANTLALAAATLWLAGCASAPTVAVVDPIGPAPSLGAPASGDGALVVYSARTPPFVDINNEEWRRDSSFGKEQATVELSHTAYSVYTQSGELVEQVRNARHLGDETPFVVTLRPGAYRVEAEAINCDGSRIVVILPVVIKGGKTTVAHLEGGWRPQGVAGSELARLPCGRVIGWRAGEAEVASTAMLRRN